MYFKIISCSTLAYSCPIRHKFLTLLKTFRNHYSQVRISKIIFRKTTNLYYYIIFDILHIKSLIKLECILYRTSSTSMFYVLTHRIKYYALASPINRIMSIANEKKLNYLTLIPLNHLIIM